MASSTQPTAPFAAHLLSRLQSDLAFLHSQNILSTPDYDLIKSKLANAESSVGAQGLVGGVAALSVGGGGGGGGSAATAPLLPVKREEQPVQQKAQCRAVWDYQKNQPDDLGFKTGDVITIEEEVNADWWKGSLNGHTGLFPSNHVERIAAPAPGVRAPPPPPPAAPAYNSGYAGPPPPQLRDYLVTRASEPFLNHHTPPAPTAYSYSQPQGYGAPEKAPYTATPPPAFPHQPYAPPPQPQYIAQPPAPVVQEEEKKKKGKFGGLGNTLAHAGVGGLGFGVGSAAASNAINAIF